MQLVLLQKAVLGGHFERVQDSLRTGVDADDGLVQTSDRGLLYLHSLYPKTRGYIFGYGPQAQVGGRGGGFWKMLLEELESNLNREEIADEEETSFGANGLVELNRAAGVPRQSLQEWCDL